MPEMNIIQAVNDCLRLEMRRDPRVVVLGEDVGRFGGVFRATTGLQEEFGADRCFDTPLAEAGIIGTAIGMALYGLQARCPRSSSPTSSIPAFDQIVNELAKLRYRSGGEYPAPVVIRTPVGGGIRGGHYHSQSPEALFIHTPGLKVVGPVQPDRRQGAAAPRHPRRGSGDLHGAQAGLPRRRAARCPRASTPSRSARPRWCARRRARPRRSPCIAWGAMVHTALEAVEKAQPQARLRPRAHRPAHADAVRHRGHHRRR